MQFSFPAYCVTGNEQEMFLQDALNLIATVLAALAQWEDNGVVLLQQSFTSECTVPLRHCHIYIHMHMHSENCRSQVPCAYICPSIQGTQPIERFILASLYGFWQSLALYKTMKPLFWRFRTYHCTSFHKPQVVMLKRHSVLCSRLHHCIPVLHILKVATIRCYALVPALAMAVLQLQRPDNSLFEMLMVH